MKLRELLYEGYKEAQAEFAATVDPIIAKAAIEDFRSLVTKNQVSGNEKNIDFWRKQGWPAFAKFVDQKKDVPTTTQVKRSKIPGKSITVREDSNWLIVIPLDKDASCFHGSNTDWCTTKRSQKHFEDYFYNNEITLVYCIHKDTGRKWAIAVHSKYTTIVECFDQQDNPISAAEFLNQTGLDANKLAQTALSVTHAPTVSTVRETYAMAMNKIRELIDRVQVGIRNPELEHLLVAIDDGEKSSWYLESVKEPQSDYPLALQLKAVKYRGHSIKYIKNPIEAVQIATVTQNGNRIQLIDDPSEEVQLAAVSGNNANAIQWIEDPSEEVQLAAVTAEGSVIVFINDPTKKVQLAAIQSHGGEVIEYIKNPPDVVKLAAVTSQAASIRHIRNPSEAIKLAAVSKTGTAIRFVPDPSEEVQLAAVSNDPRAINSIMRPTEKVRRAAAQ